MRHLLTIDTKFAFEKLLIDALSLLPAGCRSSLIKPDLVLVALSHLQIKGAWAISFNCTES